MRFNLPLAPSRMWKEAARAVGIVCCPNTHEAVAGIISIEANMLRMFFLPTTYTEEKKSFDN